MWFHRHKWKFISASCDGKEHYNSGPGPAWSMFTHAVAKCECGTIKNFHLLGSHTLENLRGEDTEIERVLKTIK